jgi:hypothetical protein
MQDVRSANPYIKRIQYLGEINRLKRITIFLRTVQSLCDIGSQQRRGQRNHLVQEHGAGAEERAFIEDCRLRLQAIAVASQYPEIYDDLLCRYLTAAAEKAAQRRVPLAGDCSRIADVAKLYHDGGIKDVTTALYVSYVNNSAPGQASEGLNLLIALTQRNAIKIMGASPELRKKVRAALHSLPKLPDKQNVTRQAFLNTSVRSVIEKTAVSGWHCSYIEPEAADYAILDDGSLSPLESVFPSALETHGGFYEHTFLWTVVRELPADHQQALGKFLRPKGFNGDLATTVNRADSEDVYRVLLYLQRLKS